MHRSPPAPFAPPARLACLLLLAGCSAAAPRWQPVPLPQARHGHRVEAVSGGLLAFGGFAADASGERDECACFWLGPGSAQWQRRADMRHGRAFFGSAVVDGSVFAIGEGVERYDAAADRWIEVVPAGALPRSHFAAAAVGRELFVLGGYPLEQSAFFAVDTASGAVRREEPPPGFTPGDHFHFLAELGGELHCAGGLDVATFAPRREHWVRRHDAWVALPAPPAGLWAKFGGQAVTGGRWYLFGDFGAYRYDPDAQQWTACAPWGRALVMPGVVAVGDAIWIVGGMQVEGHGNVLLEYRPAQDAWRDLLH